MAYGLPDEETEVTEERRALDTLACLSELSSPGLQTIKRSHF